MSHPAIYPPAKLSLIEHTVFSIDAALPRHVREEIQSYADEDQIPWATEAQQPAGQFGNAGRNILRGPASAQFDASLHKVFAIADRRKITVGVEAYNLFNHPNFGVPSNTQSPLTFGGNGDAVFRDPAGNFAANAGQILTTAGAARQIQLAGRFTF